MAESTGLEPVSPYGRQISNLLGYQLPITLQVISGAHDWNRTSYLFLTKEVLHLLSYMGITLQMVPPTRIERVPQGLQPSVRTTLHHNGIKINIIIFL
jgi:hypothetical protein